MNCKHIIIQLTLKNLLWWYKIYCNIGRGIMKAMMIDNVYVFCGIKQYQTSKLSFQCGLKLHSIYITSAGLKHFTNSFQLSNSESTSLKFRYWTNTWPSTNKSCSHFEISPKWLPGVTWTHIAQYSGHQILAPNALAYRTLSPRFAQFQWIGQLSFLGTTHQCYLHFQ